MAHGFAAVLALVVYFTPPAVCQQSLEGYAVSPGDVLTVSVFGEEQLSGKYRVGPAGTLAMPLVGNVRVGGSALTDVQETVGTALRRVIRRPAVTVALDEAASDRKVYVSGEVQKPGPLTLPFGATVADAISSAGLQPSGDLRHVKVTNSAQEPRVLDLSGLRSDRPVPAFEPVRYGDVIYVPELEDRIAVLGEVEEPGQMILPIGEHVTVLEAIGRLGGGLTAAADRSSALVIRRDRPTVSVDLRALMQEGDLTQNVELAAGDVLVVREAGKISVLGEVHAPTSFEVGEPITVVEALARAGSVTEDAGLAHSQVITDEGSVPVDLEALLMQGEMQYNLTLDAGDVLLVPPAQPETVLILGAVEKPGVIDIREQQQRDLLRLLTVAGPSEMADLQRVSVYREDGPLTADMHAVMHEGDLSKNLALQPDDVVMVPELNSVYLLGAAARTGPIPLSEDLTLLDVVSRYGNYAQGNLSVVTVVRTGEAGAPEFLKRNLAQIHRDVAPEDMDLQSGDIIFIPFRDRGVGWGEIRTALWAIGAFFGVLDRF